MINQISLSTLEYSIHHSARQPTIFFYFPPQRWYRKHESAEKVPLLSWHRCHHLRAEKRYVSGGNPRAATQQHVFLGWHRGPEQHCYRSKGTRSVLGIAGKPAVTIQQRGCCLFFHRGDMKRIVEITDGYLAGNDCQGYHEQVLKRKHIYYETVLHGEGYILKTQKKLKTRCFFEFLFRGFFLKSFPTAQDEIVFKFVYVF